MMTPPRLWVGFGSDGMNRLVHFVILVGLMLGLVGFTSNQTHAQFSSFEYLDVRMEFVDVSSIDYERGSGDVTVMQIRINNIGNEAIWPGDYAVSVLQVDQDEVIQYTQIYWTGGPNAEICPENNVNIPPRFTETWSVCFRIPPDTAPVYVAMYSNSDGKIQYTQFNSTDPNGDCKAHFRPELCSPLTLDGEATPGCWQFDRNREVEWTCAGEGPPGTAPEWSEWIQDNPGYQSTPRMVTTFNITYHLADDPLLHGLRDWLQENEDDVIRGTPLHQKIAFTDDFSVEFAECGEENAYYDPSTRTITICYELAEGMIGIGRLIDYRTDYTVAEFTVNGLNWVFLHELGHAVIDMHDLPITGQEENVADQFANLMVIDAGLPQIGPILSMSEFYSKSFGSRISWDTHSFNDQRYYNMLCLLYGKYGSELGWDEDEYIPERRAVWCPSEYEQASSTWELLLNQYVGDGAVIQPPETTQTQDTDRYLNIIVDEVDAYSFFDDYDGGDDIDLIAFIVNVTNNTGEPMYFGLETGELSFSLVTTHPIHLAESLNFDYVPGTYMRTNDEYIRVYYPNQYFYDDYLESEWCPQSSIPITTDTTIALCFYVPADNMPEFIQAHYLVDDVFIAKTMPLGFTDEMKSCFGVWEEDNQWHCSLEVLFDVEISRIHLDVFYGVLTDETD